MTGTGDRLIGLDLLRFCVATIVLSSHAPGFGDAGKIFCQTHGMLAGLLVLMPASGWAAVDIFFVLSGFLVSGLLFAEANKSGSISIGRFLVRRGFKIYPAFWVMLAVTVSWSLWHHDRVRLGPFLSELFYFQNYGVSICFHTWSLAVEEHFYFLLAFVFWVLKKRAGAASPINFGCIPDLFLMVAVLCLVARFLTWQLIVGVNDGNIFWFMHADHALLDALFFGVMLSHFWHNRWNEEFKLRLARWRWAFLGAGLLLLLPGATQIMDPQWFRMFGFILIYLGAGCLLLSCLALDRVPYPHFVNWLAWLGRHSYSTYLWHTLVGALLFPLLDIKLDTPVGWTLDALVYFTLCWLVGIIMARLIEFPMLKIRERWFRQSTFKSSSSNPSTV